MPSPLQYGIDIFLQHGDAYRQQRLALATNDAALTGMGEKSRQALARNGFQIRRLFSPEHGITVSGADGVFQSNCIDTLTGLPVISLYGENRAPLAADLEDIDTVLFDIPDVGCRFYSYLWTMTYIMEACAAYHKTFIVLDRPNPTGALIEKSEGPFLDEAGCASFIGRWNIPLKHGCTLGELAQYFASTRIKKGKIEVIKMINYERRYTAMHDFSFTPTSPAIQKPETALLYPGMGLLEGVNVNEGRGTEAPFQLFGAPWIKPRPLKQWLEAQELPGLQWKPVRFTAVTGPFRGETCYGLIAVITDDLKLRPVKTGITLLRGLMQTHPGQVTERAYRTHANPGGHGHLDKLTGIKNSFALLQSGGNVNIDIAEEWKKTIQPFLLY